MSDKEIKSIDSATQQVLDKNREKKIPTVWDRYEAQQPMCGFGQMGLCCKICTMGPCRIDPFGDGPSEGVCGATVHTIAARNLARMIAGGAAAHSDHGRDTARTLMLAAEGKTDGYKVKDITKLHALAEEYGITVKDRTPNDIAKDVAAASFAEFGQQHGELKFTHRAPEKRQGLWRQLGLMPRGIDREIVEIMHRSTMGVDSDPISIIDHGIRASLADGWGGSMIATDVSDILFGSPSPIRAKVNLGVLRTDQVNILVHGHEPTLSEMLVAAASLPEMAELAKTKGAAGINIAGICCTANEILMRHGLPIAGNHLQQELAVMTGAVEAMIVDLQCIMPGLSKVAACFHTKVISTSPKAKIPGATHIQFDEEKALAIAKEIIAAAIENYPNRDPEKVDIPDQQMDLVGGFTPENTYTFLGGRYRGTYRPLNNAVMEGRLRGAVAIVGCNNPRYVHDFGHVELAKALLKKDVLIVETGCAAIACAKAGLLTPEAAMEYCGPGLKEVCAAVGIPPVLHMGSCVDISRILVTLCNIVSEGGLGEDISDLPVAGAAPEWMSEKAVSIGFYVVASGVYTVIGEPLPVLGSDVVTNYVCGGLEEKVGGKFAFEADPAKMAEMIVAHLDAKRKALGLVAVG